MKRGYRNNLLLAAWVSVLFLQLQVVKPEITYLRARSGDIKSRFYPQNYPKDYFQEWLIEAPRGYRIRLTFKDFNVGDCTQYGDILTLWDGQRMRELCGQKLPPTIESSSNQMEVYVSSDTNSKGGRFWAHYEMFGEHELRVTTLQPTTFLTGDPSGSGKTKITTHEPTPLHTTESRGSGTSSEAQRVYLLMSMMVCVIIVVIVAICCGCKRRRRPHLQSPTPANASNNADLENEIEMSELNFADPPPSYDEVTRQSIPDISSSTQEPSGENTATEADQEIDSSGLPSYREALRLSQESLDANV